MNALVRAVCGGASAPREWRRSLRAQRVALRSALRRSPLAAVGTRVDGTVLGEELIDTLSERLARSIQGWNLPQVEPLVLGERERVMSERVESVGTMRTTTSPPVHEAAGGKPGVAASSPVSAKRSWNSGIEAAGRAVATSAPTADVHRSRVDAALAERGTEILRAVGLDGQREPKKRDAVRASPLDVALRRYRQAPPASEIAAKTPASSAPAHEAPRTARAAATNWEPSARSPVVAEPSEAASRGVLSNESPEVPQRGWWSTRVDAIHSRHESFVPAAPRAGAARFEDDATDESAFADTLAEVLHRQARAYGVVVP